MLQNKSPMSVLILLPFFFINTVLGNLLSNCEIFQNAYSFPNISHNSTKSCFNDINADGFHDGDVALLLIIANTNDTNNNLEWTGSNYNNWEGVVWSRAGNSDCDTIKRVSELMLINKSLVGNLIVEGFSSLEVLNCSQNNLTAITANNLSNLIHFDCSNNELSSITINNLNNLEIFSIQNNALPISQIRKGFNISSYNYSPQDSVLSNLSVGINEEVDYRNELLVHGKTTLYNWKKIDGTQAITNTDFIVLEPGLFAFQVEGTFFCEMSNPNLPNLNGSEILNAKSVKVSNKSIVANPNKYKNCTNGNLTITAANGVLSNDYTSSGTLTAVLVEDVSNGNLILNNDGSFTYTADLDFSGIDRFKYKPTNGTEDGNTVIVELFIQHFPDTNLTIKGDSTCQGAYGFITIHNAEENVVYYASNGTDTYSAEGYGGNLDINVGILPYSDNYEIRAEYVYGCQITFEDSVGIMIMNMPDTSLQILGDTVCLGTAANITIKNSELNTTYTASNQNHSYSALGTGNDLKINIGAPTTNVKFLLSAKTEFGCELNFMDSVNIITNNLPSNELVIYGDSICSNEEAFIHILNSELNTIYTANKSNNSFSGNGNGNELIISVGIHETDVNYEVTAINETNCENTFPDSIPIIIHESPDTSLSIIGDSVCSNIEAIITILDSESGINYYLTNNDTTISAIGNGNNLLVNAGLIDTNTKFELSAVNTYGCSGVFRDSVAIIALQMPDTSKIVLNDTICDGQEGFIRINNAELNSIYSVSNGPLSYTGVGTGTDLDISVGFVTNSTQYAILVKNTFQCTLEFNDSAQVIVNNNPDSTLNIFGDTACNGNELFITIEQSETAVIYTASNNDQTFSETGTGENLLINVGSLPQTTSFHIQAMNENGCTYDFTDSIQLLVINQPDNTIQIEASTICQGEEAFIKIHDSELNVNYTAQSGNEVYSAVGTGGEVLMPVGVRYESIKFLLTATNLFNCQSIFIDSIPINVTLLPNTDLNIIGDTVCSPEIAFIKIEDSENNVLYSAIHGNQIFSAMGIGDDIEISVGVQNKSIAFEMMATKDESCSMVFPDSVYIIINQLPNADLEIIGDTVQVGDTGKVTIYNSELNVSYTAHWNNEKQTLSGNGDTLTFYFHPINSSTTIIIEASTIYGCHTLLNDSADIIILAPPIGYPDNYSMDFNTTLDVRAEKGILANDFFDINRRISTYIHAVPKHGELSLFKNGSFSYTPDDDYFGIDTFLYIAAYEYSESEPTKVSIFIKKNLIREEDMPQGFSPNGDGINDYFIIVGIEDHPINELIVYNRSGSQVYRAINYKNTWDGRANNSNRVLPEGTYYYILKIHENPTLIKNFIYINH